MRYDSETALAAMRFSAELKSAERTREALDAAVDLLGCFADVSGIRQALQTAHLPSSWTLRRNKTKLDLMANLFRREAAAKPLGVLRRYIQLDSSPQGGWDFLCGRLDLVQLPPDLVRSARNIWDAKITTRSLPITVLGQGATHLSKKLANMVHSIMLEAGPEGVDEWRGSVFGYTSDFGTERRIADAPNLLESEGLGSVLRRLRVNELDLASLETMSSYFFPRCLFMPGHCHLLFNALQEALTALPGWDEFEGHLKAVTLFLSRRGLRQAFIAKCLEGKPAALKDLFRNFSSRPLDWRWEYMEEATSAVLPLLPTLLENYDPLALAGAAHRDPGAREELGEQEAGQLVRRVDAALASPAFPLQCEATRIICAAVGADARWCEGCFCHQAALQQSRPGTTKRRRLMHEAEEADSAGRCLFKGKRLVEMVLGKAGEMVKGKVFDASPALSRMVGARVAQRDLATPAAALGWLQFASAKLQEVLGQKLAFHHQLPYTIAGLLGEDYGYERQAVKEHARSLRREWEALPAQAQAKAHRVAQALFRHSAFLRGQLEEFCDSDLPLAHYGDLHEMVMGYALVPLAERAVEGEHAKIHKALQRGSLLPGAVCAELRFADTFADLGASSPFRLWLAQNWHSRKWRQALLCWDPELAKPCSWPEFVSRAYLYDSKGLFQEAAGARAAVQDWLAQHREVAALALSEAEKLGVGYLKARLCVGVTFCLPAALFELLRGEALTAEANLSRQHIAETFEQGVADVAEGALVVYFQVVATQAQRRVLAPQLHLARSATRVTVQAYRHLVVGEGQVHLVDERPEVVDLDLAHTRNQGVFRDVVRTLQRVGTAEAKVRLVLDQHVQDALTQALPADSLELGDTGAALLSGDSQVARRSMQEAAQQIVLLCMRKGALVGTQHSVPMTELVWSSSLEDANHLVASGLLATSADEFGEAVYQLDAARCRWVPQRACGDRQHDLLFTDAELGATLALRAPPAEGQVKKVMSCAKAELLRHAFDNGWRHSDALPRPWRPKRVRVFDAHAALRAPKAYLACLCLSDAVAAKLGFHYLEHGRPTSYYSCLLLLATLTSLPEDTSSWGEADFAALLGRSTRQAPQLEPELEDEAPLAPLPPDASIFGALNWQARAMVRTIGDIRVHLDGSSHASGIQRAYCACPYHPECHKYTQVNLHDTPAHALAWVLAWCRLGAQECTDKSWHSAATPDAEQVLAALRHF